MKLAQNVGKEIFEPFTLSRPLKKKKIIEESNEEKKEGAITLYDCLEEFKLPE